VLYCSSRGYDIDKPGKVNGRRRRRKSMLQIWNREKEVSAFLCKLGYIAFYLSLPISLLLAPSVRPGCRLVICYLLAAAISCGLSFSLSIASSLLCITAPFPVIRGYYH
jgi:hypothetical protein